MLWWGQFAIWPRILMIITIRQLWHFTFACTSHFSKSQFLTCWCILRSLQMRGGLLHRAKELIDGLILTWDKLHSISHRTDLFDTLLASYYTTDTCNTLAKLSCRTLEAIFPRRSFANFSAFAVDWIFFSWNLGEALHLHSRLDDLPCGLRPFLQHTWDIRHFERCPSSTHLRIR